MYGMTGYSFKEFYYKDVNISTEIKSVNSRFFDLNIHLPHYLNSMELNIRELLKKNLSRGKIDVAVSLRQKDNLCDVNVDLQLAEQYVKNLKKIIDHFELKDDVRLFHLTKYDDVIHIEKNRNYDKYWTYVEKSLLENINEIISMKTKEGQAIKKDLLTLIKKIKKNVDVIAKKVPKMEKDIFENTKLKIVELIGDKIDEIKLLNEVAFLVNKSCINEEVKRLQSHIEHFHVILEEKKDIGKRLDFICQEMHREINTIGSKVTLTELTGNVISVKNDIEKMREQIRNTE